MIEIVNYGDEIEISPTWFSGIQENATLLNAEIEENDYVELSENRIIVKRLAIMHNLTSDLILMKQDIIINLLLVILQ